MNLLRSTQMLCIVVFTIFSASAQTSSAPSRVQVNAPYAQKLILAAKEQHPEVQKIGLHVAPPGLSYAVVIANNLPVKIGQKDSDNDMAVERSGQPKVVRREEGSFYDLYLPINDASDRPVGMITMEIPFKFASSEEDALKKGEAICAEIQHRIPNKDALFAP
jgi:hypothetical protein